MNLTYALRETLLKPRDMKRLACLVLLPRLGLLGPEDLRSCFRAFDSIEISVA